MNFLRRLEADPNPLLAAYTNATGIPTEDAVAYTAALAADQQIVFEVLGFLAEHPGAIDHTTPGFPALINHRFSEEAP